MLSLHFKLPEGIHFNEHCVFNMENQEGKMISTMKKRIGKDFGLAITKTACLICLCLAGVACSGESRKDSSERVISGDTGISSSMSDTFAPDTVKAPEEKPVLKTTSQIMAYIEESPEKDRYMRGIIPQMAEDVPEYAAKLIANEHDGFLIVDKYTMRCYRYDKYGVEVERVGIACARPYGDKHKRRDNRTPEGFFTIEGIYDSTDWLYRDDDGKVSKIKGQFGPRFMRLRTPVTSQVGIHGTVAPWSIGGRRSHGCIRMTNENILRFAEICKPGWPVIVSPGPKDMQVNIEEGYDIPSVAVIPGKPRCKPKDGPAKVVQEPASADTVAADSIPAGQAPQSTPAPPEEGPRQKENVAPMSNDTIVG